ncbi:MAG: FAD-binding protein [Actinobacteria bacterium]|nr:FAD-binding protein [Actinomycetota bacterium]
MQGLEHLADEVISVDVLVVGTEGAGARAALEAARNGLSVLAVTKGYIGKSGATLTADADIDVDSRSCTEVFGLPGDLSDSPEKFAEDMCKEGEYLNNQELVQIHCEEAAVRTRELVDWGARIDKLTHAPGHSYPRGIWIPGTEFARVLTKEIRRHSDRIRIIEHGMITDLLTRDGRVAGAVGMDIASGQFYVVQCQVVIISAGGAMRIYPHTTAPEELTGDGLAMAFRAGAELVDMEFPMFLPYTLIKPAALDGVDFPYLLSAYVEVRALNRIGERYMSRWDPLRLEHSTRDVNSIAAGVEVLEGRGSPNGGTYLSVKHLPDNLIDYTAVWFPSNISNWHYGGFNMKEFLPDLKTDAMETGPAAHFWNGGIKINAQCETNVPGLLAAGEGTASIHGANRVSGNALTMTQVWGHRAGVTAARLFRELDRAKVDTEQVSGLRTKLFAGLERSRGSDPIALRRRIREVAGTHVGVVRDQKGLEKGLAAVSEMKQEWAEIGVSNQNRRYNLEWVEAIQIENMLQVLELVARSSLIRTESRGALYRRDFPKTDNVNWLKNIVLKLENGETRVTTLPVKLTRYRPTPEIRDYGRKE